MTVPMFARVLRLLLLLYPRRFRRTYGSELVDVQCERLLAELNTYGRAAAIKSAFRACVNLAAGVTPEQLRERRFRKSLRTGDSTTGNRQRGNLIMRSLIQDVRYALRSLARQPGFALLAVLTLALGIGANTAIFSVVNGVLLRPFPFPESNRVVMVWESNQERGWPRYTTSPANFLDWRTQNTVFERLAAYANGSATLIGAGDPERLTVTYAWADFFDVLGVVPLLGRTFQADENEPGKDLVAILSHRVWSARFGEDPTVIGRTVTLDGEPVEVVGVLPPDIGFRRDTDIWMPLSFAFDVSQARGAHYLVAIARVRDELTIPQAEAGMRTLAESLAQSYPETNRGWSVTLVPIRDQIVGDVRQVLVLLLGAVSVVLLIACANVANLALARGAGRDVEFAARAALGASRGRLVRQLLTESAVLSCCGAAVGIGIAVGGLQLLHALGPANLPRLADIRIDWVVMVFTAGIAMATAAIFGALPAIVVSRTDLSKTLRAVGTRGAAGRSGVRNVMLVIQVALAVVLLVGAGLFVKSLRALQAQDPGFVSENVVTMRLSLPSYRYEGGSQAVMRFYEDVLRRASTMPGILSAATTTNLPLFGSMNYSFTVIGREAGDPAALPTGNMRVVSPDYFTTMGIRLRRGRGFTDDDHGGTPSVVVINESLSNRYFQGEDPLGRFLNIQSSDAACPCEIVGIVSDVKQGGLGEETAPGYYLPQLQSVWRTRSLVARSQLPVPETVAALRTIIEEVDPQLAVYDVQTLDERLADAVAGPRFNSVVLGLFAAIALLLALVGIYGVESYNTIRRSHEFGVRLALGARPGTMHRLVLGHALKVALVGVVLGLTLALLTTRLLTSMLYTVAPIDVSVLAIVAAGFIGVTLFAAYLPARRATRADPVVALSSE